MKKILILLIILGGLVGTAVVYQKQQHTAMNTAASRGVKSRELLLPDLDVTAVQKIRIKDAKSETTLNIQDDRKSATIAERGGYAASLDRISTILTDLKEQRIASKQQVGKGAWTEIQVQPPGEAEGVGIQVEFLGAADKVLGVVILGQQIAITGGRSSTQLDGGSQRFVRIPSDGDTIWVVNNPYYDLEPKPESWLDKAFMDIQKVKEIDVTAAQAEESWKAGKKAETDEAFVLLDAKVGEGLDNTKVTLGTLLSAPTFNDVVAKDKVAEVMKGATKAKLVTFDGFVYDVQAVKQSKDGADHYFLSFNVTADIPKTRAPVKDEKEEDKKKADDAFAARKKSLEDKLAKEQKFAGWAFEVSEYTVNSFFKKRSEIVKVEAKAEAAPELPGAPKLPAPATSATAPAPSIPGIINQTPISVTPPPVPVPEAPKTEIKPAPEPGAIPVLEQKK